MLQYLEIQKEEVKININNNTMKIECNDLFHDKMTFILDKSSFAHKKLNNKDDTIISIQQVDPKYQFFRDNSSNNNEHVTFTQIEDSTIHNNFSSIFIINISSSVYICLCQLIISLILIVSLILLCLQMHLYSKHNLCSNMATIKELNLISNWTNPNDSLDYILLYRASSDNDDARTFHKLCDLKNPI